MLHLTPHKYSDSIKIMKILPTLYKLTEAGNMQQWTMHIDKNSYYSEEGIINGVITKNKPTFCAGKNTGKKNETTPEEQAEKEATAKWQKKLDKGYSRSQTEAFKGVSKFYEPMLAHNFNDYRSDTIFPVYSQPKLDGIRCIITKEGMFSRNGKKFVSAPHIFDSLSKFFKHYPDAILDGELYCDKLNNDFNKICSLVKKTKPTSEDLIESANTIEYWVYDAPSIGILNEEDNFIDRFCLLSNLLSGIDKIKIVETSICKNHAALDIFYENYLEAGYEGQMVRANLKYENKRSKNLLKRKEFIDEEYKIFNIVEGVGNRAGTAGYMEFHSKSGKLFKSNIKGDFEYLAQLLKDKKSLIGKMATIKYFNLTPDGTPRFPYVVSVRNFE